MSSALNNIVGFLQLERIEENIFRGASQDLGTGQVFGGQVLGQALQAAKMTVADRPAHSVHAYFLRKGDVNAPIIYEVDRSRDGRSFTARRVVAIQHGRPIFTLSASFQHPEQGLLFETRIDMPGLPPKVETPAATEETGSQADSTPALLNPTSFFEVRAVDPLEIEKPDCLQWWIKCKESLSDDVNFHRAVLAYLSDFGLLGSTLIPHGYPIAGRKKPSAGKNGVEKRSMADIAIASIDHAIWFHRPFRADQWLLYQCCAVSTSSARGLAHGSVYAEDGTLVASTTQEGLIRKIQSA